MKTLYITLLFLVVTFTSVFAQKPDGLPKPVTEPIDLNLFNIVLFFVLPVLLIAYYIYYRRSKAKKRKKTDSKND